MAELLPSQFPTFDIPSQTLCDGSSVKVSSFCRKAILTKPECIQHYKQIQSQPEGYHQCPFGMTSRSFHFAGNWHVITGIVAFPRFDTSNEREMAKRHPEIRVSRADIDGNVKYFESLEKVRADTVQEAAKVLPQAFHELRKLNGAVIQNTEKEMNEHGESRTLLNIKGAAELMRNNFDILEALSNIEGMRAVPIAATVNLFDLVYKTKRIFEERANDRKMNIYVDGVRAIIRGNQKSFPIVPAVLLENAIKYGKERSLIRADIIANGPKVNLVVENETDFFIDCGRCFDRGVRFGTTVEGGGFGLFLAREIVSAHNGTIRCDTQGKKVRMTVELPLLEVIQYSP